MTEASSSTAIVQLPSLNLPTSIISQRSTSQPNRCYPCEHSMGIFYYDKRIPKNVLRQVKIHLNKIFLHNHVFDNLLTLTKYLNKKLKPAKVVIIIYSNQPECISGIAKKRPECVNTYILTPQDQSTPHSNLGDHENIIKYVKKMFEEISINMNAYERFMNEQSVSNNDVSNNGKRQELLSLYVFNSNLNEKSFRFLSSQSLKFLLYQTYTKHILRMNDRQKALSEMLVWCRTYYGNDVVETKKINQFETHYSPNQAIDYYTQDSFVFRQVNKIFRLEDLELIFTFRLYITDLYKQIHKYPQSEPISQLNITLYRGQKLRHTVLQQLFDNLNKYISINGFMSTTKNINVAKVFAGVGGVQEGHESAVFRLDINGSVGMGSSFADIENGRDPGEELEVLFTMGSIWLLTNMEWIDGYWLIKLQPCNALDSQLSQSEILANVHTFLSMGNIARELGEYSIAKNFYRRVLDDPQNDNKTRGLVYYHMGLLADELGEYMYALDYFLEAEKLIPITTTDNNSQSSNPRPLYSGDHQLSKLQIQNNIARSYEKKRDYQKARDYYIEALNRQGDTGEKAIVYHNLGSLAFRQANYDEARRYFFEVIRTGNDYELIQDSQQKLITIGELIPDRATTAGN